MISMNHLGRSGTLLDHPNTRVSILKSPYSYAQLRAERTDYTLYHERNTKKKGRHEAKDGEDKSSETPAYDEGPPRGSKAVTASFETGGGV